MKSITGTLVLIAAVAGLMIVNSVNADARVVKLKAASSGIYEDGLFTQTNDKYEAEYSINESANTVRVENVINSDREGRTDLGIDYEITNSLKSTGFSALMVPRKRLNQKIVTAVRDLSPDAIEILILGDDFYEYCRAANGRFYLETGTVEPMDKLFEK